MAEQQLRRPALARFKRRVTCSMIDGASLFGETINEDPIAYLSTSTSWFASASLARIGSLGPDDFTRGARFLLVQYGVPETAAAGRKQLAIDPGFYVPEAIVDSGRTGGWVNGSRPPVSGRRPSTRVVFAARLSLPPEPWRNR